MSVLIKRNTTIPCRKSRSYTTVEDWQTSIDVVVYEVNAIGTIAEGRRWVLKRRNGFGLLRRWTPIDRPPRRGLVPPSFRLVF